MEINKEHVYGKSYNNISQVLNKLEHWCIRVHLIKKVTYVIDQYEERRETIIRIKDDDMCGF